MMLHPLLQLPLLLLPIKFNDSAPSQSWVSRVKHRFCVKPQLSNSSDVCAQIAHALARLCIVSDTHQDSRHRVPLRLVPGRHRRAQEDSQYQLVKYLVHFFLAGVESDAALLKMALHVAGAVAKLGRAAVDCDTFPATLEEEVEKLMNLLGTLVSSEKVGMTWMTSLVNDRRHAI